MRVPLHRLPAVVLLLALVLLGHAAPGTADPVPGPDPAATPPRSTVTTPVPTTQPTTEPSPADGTDGRPPLTGSGRVPLVQRDTPLGPVERAYEYTVPSAGSGPRPLLLVLHGRGQSPAGLRVMSGLDALGAERGFVTVYPEGHDRVWDAGACCRGPAGRAHLPDLAFLDAVLDDVAARTPVDPARVHLVGYSNGGMLAYRYACERSRRVAGVAVVAASMSAGTDGTGAAALTCRPDAPVSALAVHGGRDTTVPYAGGRVAGGGVVAPVRAGVDGFALAAGCRVSRSSRVGSSQRLDYTACEGGASVRLVKLPLLGHGWTRDSGRHGHDTTVGVWDFLAPRRAVPQPPAPGEPSSSGRP